MALSDFWLEMCGNGTTSGFIESVWPEIPLIMRATKAVRKNWTNAIETARAASSQLGPWCVVDLHEGGPSEWQSAQTMAQEYTVGVWYISPNRQPDSAGEPVVTKDLIGTLEGKAEAMANALASLHFDSFQVREAPTINASRTNEANEELLKSNMGVTAVCTTFKAHIGIVITGGMPNWNA